MLRNIYIPIFNKSRSLKSSLQLYKQVNIFFSIFKNQLKITDNENHIPSITSLVNCIAKSLSTRNGTYHIYWSEKDKQIFTFTLDICCVYRDSLLNE